MHICFVSREYPPNPMGGIGTYVANMTHILTRSGDTVSVLTQDHPDAASHGFEAPAISCDGRLRVHYLPFADRDWKIAPSAHSPEADALMKRDQAAGFGPVVSAALECLLLSEKIDAVEAPEYEAPLLFFQQRRAALPPSHPWQSIPTIVQLHSPSHSIFEHDDDPLSVGWVRARKANEALSIDSADAVLAPSAFLGAQVSRWLNLPRGHVTVIPYPIGPLLPYEPDIAPEPGLCLFVGRVEPRKGVFEFVEAAVAAARKFPQARFRFVGGPHHRDGKSGGVETATLIRSLIPADLINRFDFAGRVPRETLGAEYARASFVAVPSRWENYPNTCMEAMSCARPVLASNQGGMPEMIEDETQGIVVKGATRAELCSNLVTGLETMLRKTPGELAQMGRRSQKRILAICDDAATVRRHREYYAALGRTTAEAAKARANSPLPNVGAILFDDGAEAKRAGHAIAALGVQTIDAAAEILVGKALSENAATRDALAAWTVISGDAEGRREGLDTLAARLNAMLPDMPEVLYIGAADDILTPDSLRQAENLFANRPDCGWCASWIVSNGTLCTAFRNEPLHLVTPSALPERWFVRTRALAQCGGLIGEGFYLPDLMRDAVLRMMARGWRGGCIARPLADVAPREPGPVVTPFAFHERRDSVLAVAMAHDELFNTDTQAVGEALAKLTD
jgi:glycosyltransferase involved in cell wall biosynthesis